MAIDFSTRGPPGADGNSLLWFLRDPNAADGRFGDTAINLNTTLLFAKDESGIWQPQFELRGKRGPNGLPGPQGFGFLAGTLAPTSAAGRDGDFYLRDTDAGPLLYGPKTSGAWGNPEPLIGLVMGLGPPQPTTGFDGQVYLDRQNAVFYGQKVNGAWPAPTPLVGLLVGSGAPSPSQGYDGQTYLDTVAAHFYGPKSNGQWPTTKTPLVTVITGTVAPGAGVGIDGQTYIDTANQVIYGPKAGGVWPAGVSFAGAVANWTGAAYAAGTTYAKNAGVSYNGSSYVSLQNANTGHQPDTSPTWWQLVAQKGDTGSVSGDPQYAATVTGAQRALRTARFINASTFP
ncbi:hypothetical protein PMNALOAF_1259 [Methylobacterium adhaesivum]|uniref:Chitin-binding type-3 domain-containing protein n=1 Tax=Methylobacterium adhaesivum TaxID=333297 RepID=A0ABT8BEP7_9HYPH|nr:hypothetical protein [Methylobacterium adhaesivum]MDN3590598.1 hypothetical protein [Methylobacterium adhaesivum]GJD30016.1 hypothetical protein PMNALOAF_1259 [Methylobacterium adhaesivum]